jgi:hypothetical protein
MNKAYIVLAHHKPEQLCRLIGCLSDGKSDFFIHLDRACDQGSFGRELAQRSRWRFIKSENGAWGQLGIVKATLNGLRSVAEADRHFDVVNLISGQDYPLRSNAYIDRFFQVNRDKIFMEFFPIPTDNWADRGLGRIYDYHFGDRRLRSGRTASRWITGICNASILFKRRFPSGLTPFGGPQWWSLPMGAVNEILQFLERRPDYLRYQRWSKLPDEMFFQSILVNAESEGMRENLVNNCLRFVDWDNPNPSVPATLDERYFPALIASRSLFARKFDSSRDATILDRLDAYRAKEESCLREQDASGAIAVDVSRSADSPNSPASYRTKIGLFDQAPKS